MNYSALDIWDYVLLATSMLLCALIGLYFTNKNKNIEAYMLGDRKLSVIPVAVSLMTSAMSGLTLLGSSSELYYQGPSYSFVFLAMILTGPITAYTILPVFYRMNELSLYQYLQLRFGRSVKYISSVTFIIQMIFYNATVLYLPAMALQAVLGMDKLYSIVLIGLMGVIYSGIGGLKAVVWTDFVQAILMYASISIVGILGTYDAGGIGQVFERAYEDGRLVLDGFFEFSLTTRHTFWAILFGSTIKHVFMIGVNQVQIQRALSLSSLREAQICFVICGFLVALISLLSSYMGLVLNAAYRSCDPYLAGQIPKRDAVIMHYVVRRLSKIAGLRGVFIAGIFSATLSTLSSFSNSMAALSLEDYIKPAMTKFNCKPMSNSRATYLAKLLSTIFGLVCVIMAFFIDRANSRLLQTVQTLSGSIGVPFLACFAMGIFTRFVNSSGILISLLVTLSLGTYVTIDQVFLEPPLSPQMRVYYNEQCARVFNMTQPYSSLPPLDEIYGNLHQQWPKVEPTLTLGHLSYMLFPAIQFVLTILIASIVSLITGGWNQEVSEEYLVSMKHKTKRRMQKKANQSLDEPDEIPSTSYPSATNNNFNNYPPATIDTFKSQLGDITTTTSSTTTTTAAAAAAAGNSAKRNGRKRRMGVASKDFDTDSLESGDEQVKYDKLH